MTLIFNQVAICLNSIYRGSGGDLALAIALPLWPFTAVEIQESR
jgi:hypothetical protein